MRRVVQAALVAGTLSILASDVLPQADSTWFRFENSHFIGYSNASEKRVVEILVELEHIRAAAELTPSFVIPEGRPKTLVILPESQAEFARLAPYATMAGFAQPLDGGAAIVMPVSGSNSDADAVIRHEFAHTMLFNEWFRYPHWYAEGFAEVVSGIKVDKRRRSFVIGEMPGHYGRRIRPVVAWNDLIADDFNAHELADKKQIQAAYAQDWLLVHFLTLNPQSRYADRLDHYFALLTSGRPSTDAFKEAYGATPDDLWEKELRRYARKKPVVIRDFDAGLLDTQFAITAARQSDLQPMLRFFADKADARRPRNSEAHPVTTLRGQWDQLKLDDQCSEPLTFTLRTGSDVIEIEGFYSADDEYPVPALFAYEEIEAGAFNLRNVTAQEYPNVIVTSDFRLSIRGENVFCFDSEPVVRACGTVFHRCNRSD